MRAGCGGAIGTPRSSGSRLPPCRWSRRILRLAFVSVSYATYPIGIAVSHVVLALVYYLALTPIGLTMRMLRHDPLARGFDPSAQSYWIPRKTNRTPESYFKQD